MIYCALIRKGISPAGCSGVGRMALSLSLVKIRFLERRNCMLLCSLLNKRQL